MRLSRSTPASSALQRPSGARLDPAARGTAKSRKPNRDPAEKRCNHALAVAFTRQTPPQPERFGRPTAWFWLARRRSPVAGFPVAASLRPGSIPAGDIIEIIRPVDLHDVGARSSPSACASTNLTIQTTRYPRSRNSRAITPSANNTHPSMPHENGDDCPVTPTFEAVPSA